MRLARKTIVFGASHLHSAEKLVDLSYSCHDFQLSEA